MAKVIRIDFSKTEDRSSWNTRHINPGLYEAKVESVEQTEAKDGVAMLVYGLRPTSDAVRSRLFPFYCKIQQNQLWKLRDLLQAAGEEVPKKALKIDPNKIVGRTIAIEVEDDEWEGNIRSTVNTVYGADMVEDGDSEAYSDEDEDDWDDQDTDDLEDEIEEDLADDEDDEDGEEFDEDLDDLDEMEDDEDDDFEDDDFEEEEEEIEEKPAPKKRAPKKTAAKKRVAKRS